MSLLTLAVAIYLLGLAIGLVAVDGPVATKVLVAGTWPLGVMAFVVTIAGLLIVAMIAFPLFGALVAAGAAVVWLLLY